MKKLDINIGDVFGRLTVIAAPVLRGKYRYAEVQCMCGRVKNLPVSALANGNTRSCGCLRLELSVARIKTARKPKTHPEGSERSLGVWRAMIDRCYNPKNESWHLYGERGIKVSNRWKVFSAFYEDMGTSPKGWHLDRLNNDKGYSKRNCAWVPIASSLKNRRITLWVRYQGKRVTLTELSAIVGIPYDPLYRRFAEMRDRAGQKIDIASLVRPLKQRNLK